MAERTGGPVAVGTAWINLTPSAVGFAAKMKRELEKEFARADLDGLVQRAFGQAVTVPVRPEFETLDVPALRTRVLVDPDLTGAAEKVRRALDDMQAKVKVDLDVDKGFGSGALSGIGNVVESLARKLNTVSTAFQDAAGQAIKMGGTVAGAATTAAGPVGVVAVAVAAAAAQFVGMAAAATFAVPAVTAAAAAIASLPGIATGAAAAIATLSLGFKGIGAALKSSGGGGGGGGGGEDPASRARRIAGAERAVEAARRGIAAASRGLESAQRGLVDAERGVAEAVQRSLRAQQAVNRARQEAREDIEDLGRALRSARLDEESAALAVTEALRELNQARLTGNLPDIQRADLAYREAQLTLEEARDTTQDLTTAQAEAARKGVEGSDKVQDALRDQVDAQQAVRDAQQGVLTAQNAVLSANDSLKSSYDGLLSAQDSLAEAQKRVAAGGASAAGSMVKLAPAAQRFVNAIKALRPAFEDLRLDVQQRLFAGLDRTVTNLGNAWIPALKTTLGSYADTFNRFFKTLGANISTPKFIERIQTGAEGARKGLERIGKAVSGPLVTAFGQLSEKAAPFLTTLGDQIAQVVEEFSRWIDQAYRSGRLEEFFTNASEALRDIFTTGKTVAAIIGKIIAAIIGENRQTGKTPLDSFNGMLAKISKWLDDPENTQKIHDFVTDVQAGAMAIGQFVADVDRFLTKVQGFVDDVQRLDQQINNVLGGFTPDGTRPLGEALWEGIKEGFEDGWKATSSFVAGLIWQGPNSLIGQIKSGLGISSPSKVAMGIGGEIVNGLIRGIGDRFRLLAQRVGQIPGRVQAALGNAARILYGQGQAIVAGLANGVFSYFGQLTRWVIQLRGAVTNAFVNAGNWLYSAGRDIVRGLWAGISQLGGWLQDRILSFARNAIPGPLHRFFGIASPSKLMMEMGGHIATGLALGIEGGVREVASAAGTLADAALPALDLVANPTPGVRGTYGAPRLEIGWRSGSTGDPLLDGIRSMITVRYNGDPIAALGS